MPATLVSLPVNTGDETVDFLRRMASMVSGRNGEMLLRAAAQIESLTRRAMSAEQLHRSQQEESTRNAELREIAELASDALLRQIDALRNELAQVSATTAAERATFAAERSRLLSLMRDAEARLVGMTAELDEFKASVDRFNASAIAVPIEILRLARSQFAFLADGFAKNGDVVSQALSEIGGCALDRVLTGARRSENH